MADIIAEQKLEDTSWEYVKLRAKEIKEGNLTVRLVLDFQKGQLNAIQDQAIIAGSSTFNLYMDKLIDTNP